MTKEEAIARIKEHKIIHKMNEPRGIYISEALDMAIKALEQTIKPKSDWIPVTDKLPENGKYLVIKKELNDMQSIDIASFAKDLYEIDDFNFSDKKKKSGWYNIDNEYGYYEVDTVIAWMPLPKSYKAESEE